MLAMTFELTLSLLVRGVAIGFLLMIVGFFTQKKLNPRYEELIEARMNRVAQIAVFAIAFTFLVCLGLDYLMSGTDGPRRVSILGSMVALVVLGINVIVLGFSSYLIARLKRQGGWQSIVWAIFGATGTGLLALLFCANYHPGDDRPDFPIYRGRKITFCCEPCGRHLSDYECNAGTEGQCPKCGRSQVIRSRHMPSHGANA